MNAVTLKDFLLHCYAVVGLWLTHSKKNFFWFCQVWSVSLLVLLFKVGASRWRFKIWHDQIFSFKVEISFALTEKHWLEEVGPISIICDRVSMYKSDKSSYLRESIHTKFIHTCTYTYTHTDSFTEGGSSLYSMPQDFLCRTNKMQKATMRMPKIGPRIR